MQSRGKLVTVTPPHNGKTNEVKIHYFVFGKRIYMYNFPHFKMPMLYCSYSAVHVIFNTF